MKLMQKLSAASLAAATYVSLAVPAFAQENTDLNLCSGTSNNFCTGDAGAVAGLIGRAVMAIFIIAALLALFFLIWGGLKWILSGGDKTKVEAARGTIIAAIVGLIVTFLSFFIMQLVLSMFGLNLTNLQLPNLLAP